MAAERAGESGLRTLLVEKSKLGGVCLNEGCIPTKALLNSAKKAHHGTENAKIVYLDEHKNALVNKNKVVKVLVKGVTATLKAKNVDVIYESADVVKNSNQFEILAGQGRYLSKHVLLATGSDSAVPPIDGIQVGLKSGFVVTSRDILDLEDIPKSLVIIGGGAIGVEMATYFQAMGSNVTIIEALSSVGGNIEPEAAELLEDILVNSGVEIFLDSKVSSIDNQCVTVETRQSAKQLDADRVLLCAGRTPILHGFEKLGILLENGAVKTDDRMQTSVAGVYAAGDVNGKYMLAHVAYREAEVAVSNMLGTGDIMDYRAVPGVIYTFPEVAFVGISEQQAKQQYANSVVNITGINMSGRHVAEHGLSKGFCKLVADKDKSIILGATVIGAYASEIIYSLGLMIQNKIPTDAIKKTIFPHPTVSEIVRECIFSI